MEKVAQAKMAGATGRIERRPYAEVMNRVLSEVVTKASTPSIPTWSSATLTPGTDFGDNRQGRVVR